MGINFHMHATSPIFPFCFQGCKYNVHPIFEEYDAWINSFSEHILFSLEVERDKRVGERQKVPHKGYIYSRKFVEAGTTTIHLPNKRDNTEGCPRKGESFNIRIHGSKTE